MRRGWTAAAVLGLVLLTVACVPPTQPSPGVFSPLPGHGRDPSVDVAPSSGCSDGAIALPPGRSSLTVDVHGVARQSLVDVPVTSGAVPGTTPRRVLVSLHPFLLGPDAWDAYSGLSDAGVARDYVVLTPLGSEPGPRWAVPGGLRSDADDLGFVSALLDHVEAHICVDRNRVFAAGFSAGAAMAQALSCTMPDRFAGVAGSGGVNLTSTCPDSPGTDVLVLHGTADPIAPPDGSQIVFAPPLGLPVATVVAVDAARAGCDAAPVEDRPAATVERRTFVGCSDGRRIVWLSLVGAGHTWAGSPNPVLELVTGPTDVDLSATRAVLDFFDAR